MLFETQTACIVKKKKYFLVILHEKNLKVTSQRKNEAAAFSDDISHPFRGSDFNSGAFVASSLNIFLCGRGTTSFCNVIVDIKLNDNIRLPQPHKGRCVLVHTFLKFTVFLPVSYGRGAVIRFQ